MDKYARTTRTNRQPAVHVFVCEGENDHTLVAQAAVLVVIAKQSRREGKKKRNITA